MFGLPVCMMLRRGLADTVLILDAHDLSAAKRTPFPEDFPRVVVHQSRNSLDRVCSHGDFKAGKVGDRDKAWRLVSALASDKAIDALHTLAAGSDPMLISVFGSANRIPIAFASYLGTRLGLEVDTSVIQKSRPPRGGLGLLSRLFVRSRFSGPVQCGRRYIIVDDAITQGGTIADLRAYIEGAGGTVIAATTLIAARSSSQLRISRATTERLSKSAAEFENFWKCHFGFGFEGLTQAEGRALDYCARRNTIKLRDTISAATESR